MAEAIRNFQKRITEWFLGLEKRKKYIYVGALIGIILLVSFLVFLLTRTEYVTLSRGLSTEKAAEISNKLDELNITWRAEDNSTTILVPKKDIDVARMQLSISGVTTERGFTFEDVMKRLSFTQTAAEKNKMFLEYTVSEIENALRTIDSVKDVVVIVNVKENSSFLNIEEELSSASVKLVLAPGKKLSSESVTGIENFVMNAVKGLTAEKITIIDQTGVRLNSTAIDRDFASSSNQDALKVEIEQRLDQTLVDFLGTMYGESNVNVKTNVKLDFDEQSTNIIKFSTPVEGQTEGLLRSMSAIKEKVADKGNSGVPGTDSNTTETPQYPTGDGSNSDYSKTQETLNYELNEIQQTIVKARGQISDLSIAIVINSKLLENNQLTEADRLELTNLVTAAAGVEDAKMVEVSAMPFHEEEVIPVTASSGLVLGMPFWLIGVIVLVILLVIAGVVFIVLRRRKAATEAAEAEALSAEEEQRELEELDAESQDRSSPKYQIEKFVDSQPEAVAQLLRSWLNED